MATTTEDSQLIDEKIAALGDWRGKLLARLRQLIKQAVPVGCSGFANLLIVMVGGDGLEPPTLSV